MTIEETANYLHLSESQVREIITSEESMLSAGGSYTGHMFPIIKIGNDIFVSSAGLKEWLAESAKLRQQY